MMKTVHTLLIPLLLFLLTNCAGREDRVLPVVSSVDLENYTGFWYEIARYENRFERGCIGATAFYSNRGNYIEVVNSCYDAAGSKIEEAKGKAYPAADSNNARLRVTFFWPFYGDYYVIMLADDYRYSVVGHPDRTYLWILARTMELASEDREKILKTLPTLGYEPEKLFWTDNRNIKVE